MPLDRRLPVIVGAGQVLQRAAGLDDAREPIDLIVDAIQEAAADARITSLAGVESIRIQALLSWRYRDPGRLIAEALRLSPRETTYTGIGGNTVQQVINQTADEIQRGDLDFVIIGGGECWRTRMRARRENVTLPWKTLPEDAAPSRFMAAEMTMSSPDEKSLGFIQPVVLYPMFETAVRAHAEETVEDHQVRTSEFWARFSEVAAHNPHAWSRRELTPEQVRTPGPDNRMIGFPYPKYMNSNNDVDMAAVLLMCSVEQARRLGVPEDRFVFLHAGVDCHDTEFVTTRDDLYSSPAVRIGGGHVLELAGIGIDDVEVIDLYSCFPSAVEIGAAGLGLGLDRQLTRTGGLAFAGGPWNNYVTHAVAAVAGDLRDRPGAYGLVWGNGGFVTKHSFGIYSAIPPAAGARLDGRDIQAEIDVQPSREGLPIADAAGPAAVEAYTVMHSREGLPEKAMAACLRDDGRRVWGVSTDPPLAASMCDGEWVGRRVTLDAEGTLYAG
jgi:acetyl-CoA C-acetyltransferase